MLLEEFNVFNCGTKIEEMENIEKDDLNKKTPITTKEKFAPKVIFKILISTNVPLPFIHKFIRNRKIRKKFWKPLRKKK